MFQKIVSAVGDAYRSGRDLYISDQLTVIRVRSGMNNALYRVDAGVRQYACKLCVADERQRARREYDALQLISDHAVDIAPHPVGIDESQRLAPYPAVVYSWLQGGPLDRSADAEQLSALRDALQALHAIQPDGAAISAEAWFHWFDRDQYLDELDGFLESYREWMIARLSNGAALYARLSRLVQACRQQVLSNPVDITRRAVPMRFCHVDPNPANLIWGLDNRLRWVDWEYSGWGDPALDLADYRWHERWDGLSDEQHLWLRAHYTPPADDDSFWERVALWDSLLSCRWPFLTLRWLWSIQNGPERLRLTMHDLRASELRSRLDRLIRRAETVNLC